ncbi:MAG: hypothetical protein R2795_23470 [Saprospiraceae bacterium]
MINFILKTQLPTKVWILGLCLVAFGVELGAQAVNLEQCVTWAQQHYPTARNEALIQRVADLQIAQTSSGFWPQLGVQGQWTYQSDVTGLPFELPGLQVPTISQEQYKVWGEVFVPLTNG